LNTEYYTGSRFDNDMSA